MLRFLITKSTKNGEYAVVYVLSSLILKILKVFWILIMVISNISDTVVTCALRNTRWASAISKGCLLK